MSKLHQLSHMQICNSPQTDNHVSTPPLSFCQAKCLPVAQLTIKALKAKTLVKIEQGHLQQLHQIQVGRSKLAFFDK